MRTLRYVGVLVLFAVTLSAQTFPLTVKAYWNPNPVADAVTSYTLAVDGGAPVTVPNISTNDTNCPIATYPSGCIMAPVTIATSGQHTFVVSAVNPWATSAPATITVNISSPGQIVWVKVAK